MKAVDEMQKIIVGRIDGAWQVTFEPKLYGVDPIRKAKKSEAATEASYYQRVKLRPSRLMIYTRAGKLETDRIELADDSWRRRFQDDQKGEPGMVTYTGR